MLRQDAACLSGTSPAAAGLPRGRGRVGLVAWQIPGVWDWIKNSKCHSWSPPSGSAMAKPY
jgi:hypothetical protein